MQFGGHQAGQFGGLDGMHELVLAVAGAELEAPEQALHLAVQAGDAGLDHGLLARLDDDAVDLLLRLFDFLLDAGRVNAPVGDQLAQRHTCYLAAHGIVAADDDGFRRVVYDQVHAQRLFDGTDVAALAADNAPLHLVGRQIHAAHRELADMVAGEALDGHRDDGTRPAIGFLVCLGLHLADLARHVVAGALLDALEQHLARLLFIHGGHALQFGRPFFFDGGQPGLALVDLRLALVDFALAAFDLLQAPLRRVQPVLQALLDLFQLRAAAGRLDIHLLAALHFLFFDGKLQLLGLGLGITDDAGGLLLCPQPYPLLACPFRLDAGCLTPCKG